MDPLVTESLRLLFLGIVPILVITSGAGLLVSFLQRLIRVDETALTYSVKCAGIAVVCMALGASLVENIQSLVVLCIQKL